MSNVPNNVNYPTSGWNYPRNIKGYITAYLISGDQAHLDTAVEWADLLAANTDLDRGIYDPLGNTSLIYSAQGYSKNGQYLPNEPAFGQFATAFGEIVYRLVKNNQSFSTKFLEIAVENSERIIDLLRPINGFESEVVWDTRYNQYRKKQYKKSNLPLNMEALCASGLLATWKALESVDDPRYRNIRDHWYKLARHLSASMLRGSRMRWHYWDDSRMDDWGHGGAFVFYVALDRELGGVFDLQDEHRVWRVLDHTKKHPSYIHPMRIDGTQMTSVTGQKYYYRYLSAYKNWVRFLHTTGRSKQVVSEGMLLSSQRNSLPFEDVLSDLVN